MVLFIGQMRWEVREEHKKNKTYEASLKVHMELKSMIKKAVWEN